MKGKEFCTLQPTSQKLEITLAFNFGSLGVRNPLVRTQGGLDEEGVTILGCGADAGVEACVEVVTPAGGGITTFGNILRWYILAMIPSTVAAKPK